MKIALFTSQFPGKLNTFFARDVDAMILNGIDVDVFPIYPEDASLWKYVPEFLMEKQFPRERVRQVRMGGLSPVLGVLRILGSPSVAWDCLRITLSAIHFGRVPLIKSLYAAIKAARWAACYSGPYDVVLAYFGNYAATAAYLYQKMQVPSAAFGFFLHAGVDLYRDQVFLLEKLRCADRVFVVCEFNRGKIRELYPADFKLLNPKIQLHHLGLNLAELQFVRKNRESCVILGVGRHDKIKGFDYVLRAAAHAGRDGLRVQVVLIGEGPETPYLQELAKELGIHELVKFAGWQPFDEVASQMRRATVLVHASPEIGDAVPTVIKEAMAVGLPVLATRVAGIPELLDQGTCGILVQPKDVEALGEAIRGLLRDETARDTMAIRARLFAERMFDQSLNGRILAESIKSMCRASSGASNPDSAETGGAGAR